MHDLPYKHDIVLYLEVDSIFIAIYTYDISLYVLFIQKVQFESKHVLDRHQNFYVGCNGSGFEGLLI